LEKLCSKVSIQYFLSLKYYRFETNNALRINYARFLYDYLNNFTLSLSHLSRSANANHSFLQAFSIYKLKHRIKEALLQKTYSFQTTSTSDTHSASTKNQQTPKNTKSSQSHHDSPFNAQNPKKSPKSPNSSKPKSKSKSEKEGKVEKNSKKHSTEENLNSKVGSLGNFIAFETNLKNLEDKVGEATSLYTQFITVLLEPQPTLSKLALFGFKTCAVLRVIQTHWDVLQSIYPNSPISLRIYAFFKFYVLNDKTAARIHFNMYDCASFFYGFLDWRGLEMDKLI
jgi:hypothetical protein